MIKRWFMLKQALIFRNNSDNRHENHLM